MLWVLLMAQAWSWTCAEATNLWANEPLQSRALSRLRSGWTYTPEQLECMVAAGIPRASVDLLRTSPGEPFAMAVPGDLHTVVLDLGCGTLTVTGKPKAELSLRGSTAEAGPPAAEVIDGIATIRRHKVDGPARCADIIAAVPASARLLIYHRGSHVHVSGMAEAVEITAAEADVIVQGSTKLVEVDALKGDVLVDVSGSVEVEAGEGRVLIAAGDGATVRSTTVTGDQFIWGGPLRRLDTGSVTGNIRSQASLQPSAVVEARSNSGNVLVGLSAAQSALLPIATNTSFFPLLQGDDKGSSMRPDRTLPDGTRGPQTCFECLPGEVRNIWQQAPPVRISLASGARVRVQGPQYEHGVRVHAESLSGIAATPVLVRAPALATGHIIEALDAQAATLDACRKGLARPPPASQEDVWAHISFNKNKAQSVSFSMDGFDSKVVQCVQSVMSKWTVPETNVVEVDWPLKLLVVRSPPP